VSEIKFIEELHQYWLGDKQLISVTTLMQKHGLAPSYDGVSEAVLNAKAKRGTLIHKEIEDYCVKGELGFTDELNAFIDYVEEHKIKVLHNELLVHNDLVAGTIDLVLAGNTIADIKTTAVLHTESISWQLSIYAYLYNLTHDEKLVNGKVFHFNNLGELTVKDIPLKPEYLVERLLEAEARGEILNHALDFTEQKIERIYSIENFIREIKLQQKKAELEAELLKAELLVAMKNQCVKKFENDKIRITYVDEYIRESIDSKKLKAERPDLYKDYIKQNTVDATVKITIKD
jgi:hypothetical protein